VREPMCKDDGCWGGDRVAHVGDGEDESNKSQVDEVDAGVACFVLHDSF